MSNINYGRFDIAKMHYEYSGFEYIELPWTVDEDIANITKPYGVQNFFMKDKVFVASGEQSFLQLSLKGNLKPGKYQGISPCFRDEGIIDRIHQEYFLKLELFQSVDVNIENLGKMIESAQKFFNYFCVDTLKTVTEDGFDICTMQGIELGSYGIREFNGFHWIFGTGLAEPRLTKATIG